MPDDTAQQPIANPATPLPAATPASARDELRDKEEQEREEAAEKQALEADLLQAQQEELQEKFPNSPVPAMDKLESDIERDLLFHILFNLRYTKLSLDEAERLATDFLALLPVNTKEELLQKLQQLGQTYPEAQAVFAKYAASHEEDKRQELLDTVTQHIRSGNIEAAIAAAKGGAQ